MSTNYEMGEKYIANGDCLSAFKIFAALARDGDKRAQYQIGMMFLNGKSPVDKDVSKAVEWLEKSAKQEYADSQFELGRIYYFGEKGANIPVDVNNGLHWLEKAAKNKNVEAQYSLGMHYFGCNDTKGTAEWLKKAADAEHPQAVLMLATLYSSGTLKNSNIDETIRLFKLAADKYNIPDAVLRLGIIYCTGKCGMQEVDRNVAEGCALIDGVKASIETGELDITDINIAFFKELRDIFWNGLYNEDGAEKSVLYRTSNDLSRCIFFADLLLKDTEKLKMLAKKGHEEEYIVTCRQFLERAENQQQIEIGLYKDAEKMLIYFDGCYDRGEIHDLVKTIESIEKIASVFNRKFSSDYDKGREYADKCCNLLETYREEQKKIQNDAKAIIKARLNDELDQVGQRLAKINQSLEDNKKRINGIENARDNANAFVASAFVIYVILAIWQVWTAFTGKYGEPTRFTIGALLQFVLLWAIAGAIIEGVHFLIRMGASKPKYIVIRFFFTVLIIMFAIFSTLAGTVITAMAVNYVGTQQFQYLVYGSYNSGFIRGLEIIASEFVQIFRYVWFPMLLIMVHSLAWVIAALIGCFVTTARLERERSKIYDIRNTEDSEKNRISNELKKIKEEEERLIREENARQRELEERAVLDTEYGTLLTRAKQGDARARHELDDILYSLRDKENKLEKKISITRNRINDCKSEIDRANNQAQTSKSIISYGDYMRLDNESARNIESHWDNMNQKFYRDTSEYYEEIKYQESILSSYRDELYDAQKRLRYLKGEVGMMSVNS